MKITTSIIDIFDPHWGLSGWVAMMNEFTARHEINSLFKFGFFCMQTEYLI